MSVAEPAALLRVLNAPPVARPLAPSDRRSALSAAGERRRLRPDRGGPY